MLAADILSSGLSLPSELETPVQVVVLLLSAQVLQVTGGVGQEPGVTPPVSRQRCTFVLMRQLCFQAPPISPWP